MRLAPDAEVGPVYPLPFARVASLVSAISQAIDNGVRRSDVVERFV
jgi:hypothetical protein